MASFRFARTALLCVALGAIFLVPAIAAPPSVRLIDPVSQPLNRKAFEDRVNALSGIVLDNAGAARVVTGSLSLAAGNPGTFTDLFRLVPGNSKRGAVRIRIVGKTSAPSTVSIQDRIEWVTDGSGNVYVIGYPGNTEYAGGATGTPGTPSAPTATVNSTNIVLAWTTVANVTRGWEVYYSLDGGSTYTLYGRRLPRTATGATFTGLAGSLAAVKFRIRAFNDYGFSSDSAELSATTGASHTSDAQPYIYDRTLIPLYTVIWDDLRSYEDGANGIGGGSGAVRIQAWADPGAPTALVIQARTQSNKTAALQYVFDTIPAM